VAGVGCGWAFQSAEWLVDETGDALDDARALDAALERYRRRHRAALLPHHLGIAQFSTRKQVPAAMRALLRAAVDDAGVAELVHAVMARHLSPLHLLTPSLIARALWKLL
jgi:hypothetical protein